MARGDGRAVVRTTPDGVQVTLAAPLPTTRPAPTLIILSGVAEDTIAKPSFFQAGRYLAPRGWLCASIDLPCHGSQETPTSGKGLGGWSKRATAGDDFVAEFNGRMKKAVDYLIAEKLADPEKLAICGTSRGGFLACRYAAFDPRIKAAVGYSPVTDLRQLSEFRKSTGVASIDQMGLAAHVDELVGRPVFLVIGDRDGRVGTDAAVTFARKLSAAAVEKKVPSGVELHVVSEPRADHTTPAGYDDASARWLSRVVEGREMSPVRPAEKVIEVPAEMPK